MRDPRGVIRNLNQGSTSKGVRPLAERAYLTGIQHGRDELEAEIMAELRPNPGAIRELGEWLRAPFNPEAALRARADRGPRARRK